MIEQDVLSSDVAAIDWVAEAEALKGDLLDLCQRGSRHFPMLEKAFGAALRKVTAFRIEIFSGGAFRFEPETGHFIINAQPLTMLFDRVAADIHQAIERGEDAPQDLLPLVQKQVFRVYLLHEIRHIPQGVGDYSVVQDLKKIAGPEIMAELDVLADRDAAAAFAALECLIFDETRESYLRLFQRALFFSGQYSFPVFKFTADRTFKMARAIAVTFMAARISCAKNLKDDAGGHTLPLDSCLLVKVAKDYTSYAVMTGNPDTQVVSVVCEVPDDRLKKLVRAIEDNDFDEALNMAGLMLATMTMIN